MKFQEGTGDWTQYRALGRVREVDFHLGRREPGVRYWEVMEEVRYDALEALRSAQDAGCEYVIFTHGWSTSRPGTTTARSQIRGLMRSKDATPFIERRRCIQHNSVFVAAIRQKSSSAGRNTVE